MTPRHLLALLALLLLPACPPPADPAQYGTVRVAVVDCPEPHAGWARAAVPGLDTLGGPSWRVVDSAEGPDVTVRCTELPSGAAAEYRLGDCEVRLDPMRLPHEFHVRAAVGHELIHWRVHRGPHPERALAHVCAYDGQRYGDGTPVDCAPGIYARTAVMSPGLTGTGGGTFGTGESYSGGDLPQPDPTWADERMFRWAVGP